MEQCTASLIVIGDEILRGLIVDTNTSYLAKKLTSIGVKLQRVIVVPDDVDEIAKEISNAIRKSHVVFTSGGVGPTHDDVTYAAVAKALELDLVLDNKLLSIYTQLIPNQQEVKRLALAPKSSEVICVKSAIIKVYNVYILPGSPKYFEPSVIAIIPRLNGRAPPHFELIDIELDELSIVNILDKQAKKWEGKVKIGSYPQSESRVFTRILLEGKEDVVIEAKEELLYYLPVKKIINLNHGFSRFQMNAVLEDGKNEVHVQSALNILYECYDRYNPNEIFISFNGGKDCTVVLHLAATVLKSRNLSSLLCLYVTADSFPEVEAFVKSATKYYGLEVIRKQGSMQTALSALLKEKSDLKASLMGVRKDDPGSKNLKPFTPTDSDWPQLMRVNPILNWTYSQVWAFLLTHNIPYCPLYDEGYTSIGSKSTTIQNPLLKNPKNPSSYQPAYTLSDKSAEREGRE